MEYISIGNTIGLQWSVEYYGGGAFPLEDCAVRLFMVTSRGRSEITDFSTAGNAATWTFDTVDQYAGSYSFIMVISDGGKINSRMVWDHALRLSSYSGANSTDMILTHTSTLDALSTAIAQYDQLSSDDVKTALETLSTLEQKINSMDTDIDAKVDEAVSGIEDSVIDLDGRVTTLEETDFDDEPTEDETDYPEINA